MRLSHLTLTGVDDSVDPWALTALADALPILECAVLLDVERSGDARFPSSAWRRELYRAAPGLRIAAHVCGVASLTELAEGRAPEATELGAEVTGRTGARFGRVQLNFDASRLPPTLPTALATSWRDGRWRRGDGTPLGLVTQYNAANREVHRWFAHDDAGMFSYPSFYGVLFDESGGLGVAPRAWPRPLAGLRCGYAGGIAPANVRHVLSTLQSLLPPDCTIWIDMESGVRSDDRFDLAKAGQLIELVR